MKTTPYPHQEAEFYRTRSLPNWALWWDQGTGKTKVIIDTMDFLYSEGKIDAMLVLAPGGVESNWIYDEIPTHSETVNWKGFVWSTGKRHTKKHKEAVRELFAHDGLKVLAVNFHSIMTDDCAKEVRRFLDNNRVLYVCDEASAIKNANTKTTKTTFDRDNRVVRYEESTKESGSRPAVGGTPGNGEATSDTTKKEDETKEYVVPETVTTETVNRPRIDRVTAGIFVDRARIPGEDADAKDATIAAWSSTLATAIGTGERDAEGAFELNQDLLKITPSDFLAPPPSSPTTA